jgi:hypothetical protein
MEDFLCKGTKQSKMLHFVNILTTDWIVERNFLENPPELLKETEEGLKALSFHLSNIQQSENEEVKDVGFEASWKLIIERPGCYRLLIQHLLDKGFEEDVDIMLEEFGNLTKEIEIENFSLEEVLEKMTQEEMLLLNRSVDLSYYLSTLQ